MSRYKKSRILNKHKNKTHVNVVKSIARGNMAVEFIEY